MAGDALLKCLAVHCRTLMDIDLQLAMDASEDGLLALAGKSILPADQGRTK